MEKKKTVKREIEEEVIEEVLCDNCKKKIEGANCCGFGQAFKLNDAWCYGCGGKHWDFCSFKCLKEFVNKNKLAEPQKTPPTEVRNR
jgi:hypothetical protein